MNGSGFKNKITCFFCFLTLIVFVSMAGGEAIDIPASINSPGVEPRIAAEIDAFVKAKMIELHSPGIAVGIVIGDEAAFHGYFGYADIESKKPVDENTMFRIGSISKTMATIGLFQQWELGKFKIDDDVNKYLPKPYLQPPHPNTKPITFENLLTHTSGGGEILSYRQLTQKWLGMLVEGNTYPPLEVFLADGMKTKIDPGVKWAYSNFGFGYIGLALETISGVPFHEYEKKNVFEPLGMTKTSFHHDGYIMEHIATGYRYADGKYSIDPHKAFGVTSAGNVYSTAKEMSLYMTALLNGAKNANGSVIKPETLAMLMSTHYTLDERMSGWGYGFEVYGNDVWGRRIVGHSGSVPFGFTSLMLLSPNDKIGVIVLSNSWIYSPKQIGWGIMKIMLAAQDKPVPDIKPDPNVWKKLEGYYGPEYPDLKTDMRLIMGGIGKYRITEINGKLYLVKTWRGKGKAEELAQVNAADPYFYLIKDRDDSFPQYISFKKKDNGKFYLIIGGLNEYVRLGAAATLRAKTTAVPGKVLKNLIP